MRRIVLLLLLSYCISAFAWNSTGHRIIAQIAYDQLTPQAKQHMDELTDAMFHSRYPDNRFSRAATWPDKIKKNITTYNQWHYINLPYVKSNVTPAPVNSENIAWAIDRAEKIISDPKNNNARRAKYLSFLIHFVGDIEQPLHCATLYDKQFPHGDRGGNDYLIQSPMAKNLHQLWDCGLGLFVSEKNHYQFHYYQVQTIATEWMHQYPRSFFAKQLAESSPMQWAQDSHQVAITFAYTLPENTAPSENYIKQGQKITQEQIVLAGDRLADTLNHLFST